MIAPKYPIKSATPLYERTPETPGVHKSRHEVQCSLLNRVPCEPRPIFREEKKDHESNSGWKKTEDPGPADAEVEVEQ